MVEVQKATQQSVLEFINDHMSKDFSEAEILGLQKLISEFGPEKIMGKATELLYSLENNPMGTVELDLAVEEANKGRCSGIHEYIKNQIVLEKSPLGSSSSKGKI